MEEKSKHKKITPEVELSIIALRTTFGWDAARIKQGLDDLPEFMREKLRPGSFSFKAGDKRRAKEA